VQQFDSLLNAAEKAAALIRKHAENGALIHVVSHLDADGLSAAGIIGKALFRLNATFRVRIERWLDQKIIESIQADKPSLIIFCDFGSGDLGTLNASLSGRDIVILDHHQLVGEADSSFIQVNPHVYGVDGSKDLSAAGATYLVAKAVDKRNTDLACIAVVGALGDLQDKYEQRKLGGPNATIMQDAVNSGFLTVESDLLFFGRETRHIHKALAATTTPFISGLSGEEDRSLAFLASLGITPKRGDKWRALRDLSDDEKKRLFNALVDLLVTKGLPGEVAMNLLRGSVYTLTQEEPWTPLRDAREFAVLLNATGRMDKPSLGVAICMGDRRAAFEEATQVLEEYRRTITKYLSWLMEPESGRIEEMNSIYVVRGESVVDDKVIGTISSILSTNLAKPEKPIIAYSTMTEEGLAKISARTIDAMTNRGVNLAEALRIAAEKYSGKGGGHNIAAGAQVPISDLEAFLKLVDEIVRKQLEGANVGS